MNWIRQTAVVTLMVLRTIPQRLGWSLAAAFGVGLVVAVMVAVFSIAAGFRATLTRTGSEGTALVLRSGTESEMSSNLTGEDVRVIVDKPGIRRGPQGPIASAEMYVIVDLPKRSTGTDANVPLRGVQPSVFEVRDYVRMVEGRPFEPGRNEIVAGVGAAREFAVDVGQTLRWGKSDWRVVGLFSSEGTLADSELWCDVRVLQPAYHRENNFQSVYAKLESEEAFGDFKDSLTTDKRLSVKVIRENEYYASQSEQLDGVITYLGGIVTALMAIGAIFGAINTMYSAVASRTREIATLRALGFGSTPVVTSVLVESLLLALVGGLAGGIGAYLALNGYRTATLNWQSFSQVVFALEVTPMHLVTGLLVSLVMGLLGGLLPAIRAARVPVAVALREL